MYRKYLHIQIIEHYTYTDSYPKVDNTSLVDNITSFNISIRESSVMNVKDMPFRKKSGMHNSKDQQSGIDSEPNTKLSHFW